MNDTPKEVRAVLEKALAALLDNEHKTVILHLETVMDMLSEPDDITEPLRDMVSDALLAIDQKMPCVYSCNIEIRAAIQEADRLTEEETA